MYDAAHKLSGNFFYNVGMARTANDLGDKSMSTTLYNKIPLGRNPLLDPRMQAAIALGVLAGAGLVWAAVRVFRDVPAK
jgi:hypothetical protein